MGGKTGRKCKAYVKHCKLYGLARVQVMGDRGQGENICRCGWESRVRLDHGDSCITYERIWFMFYR